MTKEGEGDEFKKKSDDDPNRSINHYPSKILLRSTRERKKEETGKLSHGLAFHGRGGGRLVFEY